MGNDDTGKFNALRGTLLEKSSLSHQVVTSNNDEIIQIDTTIDDQSGEELGYIMSLLLEEGALDVHYTPVYTKKTVRQHISRFSFKKETSNGLQPFYLNKLQPLAFVIKTSNVKVMTRTFETQQTSLGAVKVKKNQYGTL